jgi:hypothetical protein
VWPLDRVPAEGSRSTVSAEGPESWTLKLTSYVIPYEAVGAR